MHYGWYFEFRFYRSAAHAAPGNQLSIPHADPSGAQLSDVARGWDEVRQKNDVVRRGKICYTALVCEPPGGLK